MWTGQVMELAEGSIETLEMIEDLLSKFVSMDVIGRDVTLILDL
jgi:hypothetical protein